MYRRWLVIASVLVVASTSAMASLRMPAIFGDGMVLQRDKEIALWGWSDPGEGVTVEFAGRLFKARSDEEGAWRVSIPAQDAGGPYTLTVESDGDRLAYSDVLIGEVWVCSGQSNMDMRMYHMPEQDIQDAEHPQIRLFRVERAVSDEPEEDFEGVWEACTPSNVRDFSALAYYLGLELQRDLDVPVGVIHSAYGGTGAEVWTRHEVLMNNPVLVPLVERYERSIQYYEEKLKAYESGASKSRPTPILERRLPSGLYNAMIHPMAGYTIRGFTWYQGESNTWRARQYETLLREMIIDWRRAWGDQTLPFGVVQLTSYVNPPRVPVGIYSWPELRESQWNVVKMLPNTGLVVTIDVGNPTDIHPKDKKTIAQRLAGWAMSDVYGDSSYRGASPAYWEVEFDDEEHVARVKFKDIGSGLTTRDGEPPRGFIIAGEDMRFRWAEATIDGDVVILSSGGRISKPRSIRYAWDENPYWANLISEEGLPVIPFRTDDWEGITDEAR